MTKFYIYEIRNLVNNKTYIGQRKCPIGKEPETDSYFGSGLLLKLSIKKYGKENFEKVILYKNIQLKETVNAMERFAIEKARKLGKAEYNIADGGDGGQGYRKGAHLSDEVKNKIREGNKGKKVSIETKMKMSDAAKQRKGRTYSDETKIKISESEKLSKMNKFYIPWNKGKSYSVESTRKYIRCIETGEVHFTSEWWNLGYSKVVNAAKNNKTCKGLHFEYIEK